MCADMKPANSTTWRALQNIVSARPTPTNLVVEGGREVPLTTAANHLVSFFKKKAVKHPEAKEPQAPPRPTSIFRAITRQELVDVLRYIKCHRTCGRLPKVAWTRFDIASDTDLTTMDSVQARGARPACGLPATTNTYDSLLEANLPPVSEKAKLLAYKSFLVSSLHGGSRAANVSSCFPPSSEIGKLHTEITEAYGSVEPLTDAPELNHRILIRPWTLQAVTKEMADAVKKRASDEAVAHRHPADYELWTDGSYVAETSSVAGAALIFAKGKESCKTVSVCGKGRSSFRSECLALHAGLARVIADRTLSRG
ncbi:hypothetical protein XU18_4399 [Perkinsela sp. CCAP 1560/4]|nr:hypothetical protein XU18_4399 [Perkinsela sp. CCAP 1560/4]|eukprot:KNH04309.1 hypothetical protein XU18_4399 [Perkinsela sp. CCAP 1560/4]